jgi:hypothetical protein
VRTILSISTPYAALVGALNDRLLLAHPTDISPKQKKGIEIKSCLVGLLEPLLIGFSTMQQTFEQKVDLSEILYQITTRLPPFLFSLLTRCYIFNVKYFGIGVQDTSMSFFVSFPSYLY